MNGPVVITLLFVGVLAMIFLGNRIAWWIGGWWEDRRLTQVYRRERAMRALQRMQDR